MDFDELNRLAFQCVMLNTYESWVALEAKIKERKRIIVVHPYSFTDGEYTDFSGDVKKDLELIKQISNRLGNLIGKGNLGSKEYDDLAEISRGIKIDLTQRVNYKFSDGNYFTVKNGIVLHLLQIPLLQNKKLQNDYYDLFKTQKFLRY